MFSLQKGKDSLAVGRQAKAFPRGPCFHQASSVSLRFLLFQFDLILKKSAIARRQHPLSACFDKVRIGLCQEMEVPLHPALNYNFDTSLPQSRSYAYPQEKRQASALQYLLRYLASRNEQHGPLKNATGGKYLPDRQCCQQLNHGITDAMYPGLLNP